jgi:tRNA(fMet)-specific endonuclease VapC
VRRYLLDTNHVSDALKGHPCVLARLARVPVGMVAISAITAGEMRYGLAWRRHPLELTRLVNEFMSRVHMLEWGSGEAEAYGELRAECRRRGIGVGALDLLIAAQARAADAVLVTRDRALSAIPGLVIEDWSV